MNLFFLTFLSFFFLVSTLSSGHAFGSDGESRLSDWCMKKSLALSGSEDLTKMQWDQSDLIQLLSVRLVKKSWKPIGVTYDEYKEEFSGDVAEAYKILRANTAYDYIERPMAKASELFTADSEFDPNLESIIFFHPLFVQIVNPTSHPVFVATLTALAMRNIHKRYNLFVMDMGQVVKTMLKTIGKEVFGFKPRYEDMAEASSSFIIDGVRKNHWKPSNIHMFGASYSGNLIGYVARYVYYVTKTKINSLMSLDPYSAGYNKHLVQVNRHDAEVVHILHTSSYFHGTRDRIATADFVFNSGFLQPDCYDTKSNLKTFLLFYMPYKPFDCSHRRVNQRFWYLVLYPKLFQARQCDTYSLFRQCGCEDEPQTFLSYPIVNREARGTYYLRTDGHHPYGLGEEGTHCLPAAKEELEQLKKRLNDKWST